MMARSEVGHEDRLPGLKYAALGVLLGFVSLFAFGATAGLVMGMLATKTFVGPSVETTGRLALLVLVGVGAMWISLRLKPTTLKTAVLSAWLGIAALLGLAQTAGVVKVLLDTKTFWGPWNWRIPCLLSMDLLIGFGAIGGVLRLKPWQGWQGADELVSPATRRTNKLFGLSGLVGVAAAVALVVATKGAAPFSNSPVSPGVAVFAITSWLLAMAIGWWWYFSADEHERRANDFGNIVALGLFTTVTPVWWVAARADLLPQPNAMVLWLVTVWVSSIGWFWRRNR